MRLGELLAGVPIQGELDGSMEIEKISLWPAKVGPGCLFVACRLPWMDPVEAIREAIRRGASAVLIEHGSRVLEEAACGSARVFRTGSVNRAYALACANYFKNAHRDLVLIGVTGTKGKTTTCHLIEAALRHAGYRTGLISSVVQRSPDEEHVSVVTTPEPARLHSLLHRMRMQGVTHVVVEVSSIGLAEDRLHGLRFDAVVFTNIGCEHWEYHGGVEAYTAAKARLFVDPELHVSNTTLCVANADDRVGAELARHALGRVQTYGLEDGDVRPISYETTENGSRLRLCGIEINSPLGGKHNVYNLLAAFTLAEDLLGSPHRAAAGVQELIAVPGRLERLPNSTGVDVFVDYAHSPESVEAILRTFGPRAGVRKLVVVLGCSGSSDRGKRGPMARAALAGSDLAILTADNPGREDPLAIIAEMLTGLDVETLERENRLYIIPDRAAAIKTAIEAAAPAGVAILLGKGSERTQAVNGRLQPFDDREIARQVLDALSPEGEQPAPGRGGRPLPRTRAQAAPRWT